MHLYAALEIAALNRVTGAGPGTPPPIGRTNIPSGSQSAANVHSVGDTGDPIGMHSTCQHQNMQFDIHKPCQCSMALGGLDGPHGKSRMRSKSEEPKMTAEASTASVEISRLRQRSTRKRASPAATEALRCAAIGALQPGAGSVSGIQKAAGAVAAAHLHQSSGDLQLLQQGEVTAPAKPHRRRRQRAHSHGSSAGSTRTLSVPAASAPAEFRSMFAGKQPFQLTTAALSEAPDSNLTCPTEAPRQLRSNSVQSGSAPPASPRHRRRRPRSIGPLSADILSAHAAAQASLRTQSVSTLSVTSCPKLDELLSVLWASSTASKQRGASPTMKTYSEPWMPLQRSRCPVLPPFGQPAGGSTEQPAFQPPLENRSPVCGGLAAASTPAPAAAGAAVASSFPSAPQATDAARGADVTKETPQRRNWSAYSQRTTHDVQQDVLWIAPATGDETAFSPFASTAASAQFSSITLGISRQPAVQLMEPAAQVRRSATAAQSPFAAPDLQAGTTSADTTTVQSDIAAQQSDPPALDSFVAAQASNGVASRQATSSKHGEGRESLQPAGSAAAANPVNDYLAIMQGAHSEALSMASAPPTASHTFQSPFSKVARHVIGGVRSKMCHMHTLCKMAEQLKE